MISVLLSYSEESKAAALADGFKERTVLVKWEPFGSNRPEVKAQRETQIMREVRPNQFFIGDFWGAGPD
jgi:hypothetical protein